MNIQHFSRHIKGDIFGGLTAAIVALPLALAFGVQSGMGASSGLYAAALLGVFAALFGGTSTQISGPTAPMTVISAAFITLVIGRYEGNLDIAIPIILSVFLLSGVFQVVMGVLKIGTYVKYIPYPVVSGFMTGIGVIILITQLFSLLGYNPSQDKELIEQNIPFAEEIILEKILKEEAGEGILVLDDFKETIDRADNISEENIEREAKVLVQSKSSGVIGSIRYLQRALTKINWYEFLFAILTIVIVYGFKYITKVIPSTLVALILITIVCQVFNIDILTIGDKSPIPSGLPKFRGDIFTYLNVEDLILFVGSALTLAFLGVIDSLLTSIVADNLTNTKHKSNKEIIGQGIGNSISALFGGIPGAGATIRTVVNIDSGGKTKISGIIHGLLLLLILVSLGDLASKIPLSVLCGILITVGIGVMDHKGLKTLRKMPLSDALVLLVVLILTVFLDLITAVGVGFLMSCVLFVKKMDLVGYQNSKLEYLVNKKINLWKDESIFPEDLSKKVIIKHMDGPLFFGSIHNFGELGGQIPTSATHLIVRMDKVKTIDQSAIFVIENRFKELQKSKVTIILVGVDKEPYELLEKNNIIPGYVSKNLIFNTFDEAIKRISK